MTDKKQPFEKQEVMVTQEQMNNFGLTDPKQVLEVANKVARYVNTNELTTIIQGTPYVQVEGWQFAGSLFGLIAKVVSYNNQSDYSAPIEFKWRAKDYKKNVWVDKKHTAKGLYKYFAEAHCVTADGRVIGQGFAMCSNEEVKKHTFDEYAILSMAQTRAVGKAYRMAISFIIKAAGYNPTPAEEMDSVEEAEAQAQEIKLPKKILDELKEFKDAQEVRDWANRQKAYHKNAVFLDEVSKKIRTLEKKN